MISSLAVEAWLDKALADPIVMLVLILILGAVAYAALKRLLKLAVLFVLGFGLLSGYFWWTNRTPPPAIQTVQDKISTGIQNGAKRSAKAVKNTAKEVGESVKDEIKRTAKTETKKAIEDAKDLVND